MDLQAKVYQRDKDPFVEPAFPKAFYYPSPVKEVSDHVAIYSPERVKESHKKEPLEERFLKDNTSFKIDISSLNRLNRFKKQKEDDKFESTGISPLDESFPDNDQSTQLSITRNESQLTSASVDIGRDNTNTNNNISDIVKELEVLRNKQGLTKQSEDINENVIKTQSAESVLQRYIERFRNSPPKPREERLKEREVTRQDFWWLGSSPGSNTSVAEGSQGNSRQKPYVQSEYKMGPKLTREALLAIDEETLQLQRKADKLLSQSEVSLTSSGPIVSTEGLGSSASVSDLSIAESQPAYKPAFARDQGPYSWPASRAVIRRDENSHTDNIRQQSTPADDILVRWRLNRKMEKTTLETPALGRSLGRNIVTQNNIDPRLEEFRKKLLTQRALVTTEDIHYERQRMAMLLDDDDKEINKKDIQIKEVVEPAIDPILVRMSKITSNGDIIAKPSPQIDPVFYPRSLNNKLGSDKNFNNASNSPPENLTDQTHDPGLNINNTASSDRLMEGNTNPDHGIDTKISVDNFTTQEVCNPASKVYALGPSEKSDSGLISDDRDIFVSNFGKVEKEQGIKPVMNEVNLNPPLKDPGVKSQSLRDSTNATRRTKDANGGEKQFEGSKTEVKKKIDADHINRNIYHQFLKAEKPIDENNESDSSFQLNRQKGNNKKLHSVNGEDFKTKSHSRKEELKCQRIKNDSESGLNAVKKKKKQTERFQKEISESGDSETFVQGELPISEDYQRSPLHMRAEPQISNRGVSSRRIKDVKKYGSQGEPNSTSLPSFSKCAVNAAIGQTIADHIFDGSTVMSSVDSWASMFPQSPAATHSPFDSHLRTPSPVRGQQPSTGPTPLQSTPLSKISSQVKVRDEDNGSDCEFEDDSILIILRSQRSQYLKQLEIIEHKLQKIS